MGGVIEHLIAEQQRTLCPPLEIACPQMDVEDVQQDTVSKARSHTGRCFQSSYVILRLWARSCWKSCVRRAASSGLRAARLTSSLMPNERLSKLVEPTTPQCPSTMRILA